jgi:RNA recognition motif-containing protein
MNIYVGNVAFTATENQLSDLFAEYGEVTSVKIITDKFTGRSKGFAFVEMTNDTEANEALNALNGLDINGRNLNVTEARPKEERPRNDYRGGGDRGGDRGGNGGGNRRY